MFVVSMNNLSCPAKERPRHRLHPWLPVSPWSMWQEGSRPPCHTSGWGWSWGVWVRERCIPIDVVTRVCPVTVPPRGKWPASEGKAGGGNIFLQLGGSGTAFLRATVRPRAWAWGSEIRLHVHDFPAFHVFLSMLTGCRISGLLIHTNCT